MTTSTTPNQPTMRMPSQRDFEIFRLAVIKGFTHKELAGMFEISRRRVSQIVENVRNWLSQHPCEDPNIATELQNKRLAQHLERMHLDDIIVQARHEVSFGKRQLITTTEKPDGTKTTTYREQPFNVQVLKTYLRAIEALGRLNARPEIPIPAPPGEEFPWLINAINECYEKWYSKIWSKRLNSEMVWEFVNDISAEMLKAAQHQQELDSRPSDAADGDNTDDREGCDEIPLPSGEGADGHRAEGVVGEAGEGTPARSASEGHVRSTTADSSAAESADSDSSLMLGPSSLPDASRASQTSLREAPSSQGVVTASDDATASVSDTLVNSGPPEMSPANAAPSQENQKREAPLNPSLCPSVPLSPCPSVLLPLSPDP